MIGQKHRERLHQHKVRPTLHKDRGKTIESIIKERDEIGTKTIRWVDKITICVLKKWTCVIVKDMGALQRAEKSLTSFVYPILKRNQSEPEM